MVTDAGNVKILDLGVLDLGLAKLMALARADGGETRTVIGSEPQTRLSSGRSPT